MYFMAVAFLFPALKPLAGLAAMFDNFVGSLAQCVDREPYWVFS